MYAIMYLPEALWVRDVRGINSPSNNVIIFDTEEDAEEYIRDILLPYSRGMFTQVIREYLQIFPIDTVDNNECTKY